MTSRPGWRHSTWGDEISLEYGKGLRTYSETGGSVRVFGTNGPVGWTDTPLAAGPGMILGRKGAYRGVHFTPDPFYVIDTAYYVVTKTDLDMRWIYYAIKHHQLGQIDDGSPIPSTTRAAVYPRELDVPPIEQQRAVAHILGSLDDKIELNRRMNRTLEQMAAAIFKAWFVDFEPVKAKAAGAKRFPSMPQPGFDALPTTFADSLLGSIPTGWEATTWGQVATLEYGKGLRGYEGGSGKCRVYGTNGPIGWHTDALCNGEGVVIGRKGAYRGVHYSADPFFVIDTAFYLKPTVHVGMKWAFFAILEHDINGMDSGSAIPSTSRDAFYRLPVSLPPCDLLDAFERIVSPFFALRKSLSQQNDVLAAIRDALLPKLLSGEIRVGRMDRVAEGAG